MNNATFELLRRAVGLDQDDVAEQLDINERTVRRWETGKNSIPEFASDWLMDKWVSHVSRVDAFIEQIEHSPEGTEVTLSVYPSQESLERAGSDLTVREMHALNRSIALEVSLLGLIPVAVFVPEEA